MTSILSCPIVHDNHFAEGTPRKKEEKKEEKRKEDEEKDEDDEKGGNGEDDYAARSTKQRLQEVRSEDGLWECDDGREHWRKTNLEVNIVSEVLLRSFSWHSPFRVAWSDPLHPRLTMAIVTATRTAFIRSRNRTRRAVVPRVLQGDRHGPQGRGHLVARLHLALLLGLPLRGNCCNSRFFIIFAFCSHWSSFRLLVYFFFFFLARSGWCVALMCLLAFPFLRCPALPRPALRCVAVRVDLVQQQGGEHEQVGPQQRADHLRATLVRYGTPRQMRDRPGGYGRGEARASLQKLWALATGAYCAVPVCVSVCAACPRSLFRFSRSLARAAISSASRSTR